MGITFNRLKHSLAVANKMKSLAQSEYEKYPVNVDDAFVLGMVHDIGYEFAEEQKEHAKQGGLVLKKQGYVYWKEVYYHGIVQTEYDSKMLRLLNYADLTTGPHGDDMTIDERISDIANRYGKGSWQEVEAIKLARMIQSN
jgi:predicted hydrolase (HD superfamily)